MPPFRSLAALLALSLSGCASADGDWVELAGHERVLVALVLGVLVLFVAALAFAVLVLLLRVGHLPRRRRQAEAHVERGIQECGGACEERGQVFARQVARHAHAA